MDQNLKREIILEHYQNPVNKGLIDDNGYILVNTNIKLARREYNGT